ncbi:MAG: hypothetical protein ACI92A_002438, partial [Candidatus Paceibacteria bacterium]
SRSRAFKPSKSPEPSACLMTVSRLHAALKYSMWSNFNQENYLAGT